LKAQELLSLTNGIKNVDDVLNSKISGLQYDLVEHILSDRQCIGRGILVFVSGMPDIVNLSERFEKINESPSYANRFKVYIIHSEIPLEEQQEAFLPVDSKHVKVVIATNAAESSITIPDVDIVVCLGTSKSVQYNSNTHLSYIQNSWISKASGECTHSIQ